MLALLTLSTALAFDHGHAAFADFLGSAVTDTGVDYQALKGRTAKLDAYLAEVAKADVSAMNKEQQLAFWVNAYNAYTVHTMLKENLPSSIQKIDGGKVWQTRKFMVAGKEMTLNDMEHGKARKLADGRVHAVVNCASKGCPPLPPKPLTGSGVDAQLDAAAKRWVRVNAYSMKGGAVGVSKIFDWYGSDFGKATDEKGKLAVAKAFIVKFGGDIADADVSGYQTYDWSINKR